MNIQFAEAFCAGHPNRLADLIADRIVEMALSRDSEAVVGVEVALHRDTVFVDGRIAVGGGAGAVSVADVEAVVRASYAETGYSRKERVVVPSLTRLPLHRGRPLP